MSISTVLSTSFGKTFWLALYSEIKLNSFCQDLMQKLFIVTAKYLCTKTFIPFSGFKCSKNSIFPIVKLAANYAKIDRVGSLDEGFQQVHNIVMEHQQ